MPSSLAMRQHMILGQLYTNDIHDKRILNAMGAIKREDFLPEKLRGAAYVDEELEVSPGRFLMSPLTFAKLLNLAEITPSCRVLLIGCLSGYYAAVIAQLAGPVFAVDNDAQAVECAREHMKRLKIPNVTCDVVKAMNDGYALCAPYDVIVIAGAVCGISEALGSQLSIGGRLVTVQHVSSRPGIKGGLGKGLLVKRLDHKLQHREHFDAASSLLPGFENHAAFAL